MENVSIVNCNVIFLFVTISSPHVLKNTLNFTRLSRFAFSNPIIPHLTISWKFFALENFPPPPDKSSRKWVQQVEIHYNCVIGIVLPGTNETNSKTA